MKSALLAFGLLMAAPAAWAQENPVKDGVEAWERGDYPTAVAKWRPRADAGDADAQFNLGQAYRLGRGVKTDIAQAEAWFRKAALQAHPQAEDNYGVALFQNGKRADAVQWLKRSAARGEPRAQYILGTMFFNGDAVEKDWVRAYALMTRASQSGLSQASAALVQMNTYLTLDERQQGAALARKYEEEAGRAPLPPVTVASGPKEDATTRGPGRITPPPARRPATPAPVVVKANGAWRVQLGAFGDPANARRLWSQVAGRFPGRQVYYVKAGGLTRVLVGPFSTRGEAAASCGSLKPCVPATK